METTRANVAHISWLNTFEVGERGRFPSDHICSGGVCRGKKKRNEPQGMSVIQLRHLPKTGRSQAQMGTLLELTFGIFPNTMVRET